MPTAATPAAAAPDEPTTNSLNPVEVIAHASRTGSRLSRWLAPLITLAVVIGIWTFISDHVLDPTRQFLLPSPLEVWRAGIVDSVTRAEILNALWSTTKVALVGLSLSIIFGVLLAVLMSQARWIELSLYPYAVILQTIPILAVVPLLGFWFGYEFTARVIVCVLISIFPVITNTLFGIRSVDSSLHDQFSLFRASRLQRLRHLQLPAALPTALTGCTIAAGLSVVGSIIADFFFRQGEPGIGRLIDSYRQSLETDKMIAALLLSSAVGVLLYIFFDRITHWVTARRSPARS
ncbi:NitT/TauT family transport system permease protein [Jatrophihabitans sp. GAS493]|uniref:ABC transporter permease n=1 Tax=Jatrophihabitans sp. GAS493 TaxID=1907575 RepID=UPI000BB98009|nr:ABC transporter permease [Jatrophihabitans sp. GAS493]SOD70774.1 NitT/TauT family transport system permease protein [Jatrophihabitans sp. GAS493]